MFLDTIHGTIERRILLNYCIAPEALRRVLPAPFRPKLYRGYGIGGVCMIRFGGLRRRGVPLWLGMKSENAAHRIAVEWQQDGALHEGVFIPRRDTNSWFNKTLGGTAFPGIFNRSRFKSREDGGRIEVEIAREDGDEEIAFAGSRADLIARDSVFATVTEAAEFFSLGATGYSATWRAGHYHGMELHSLNWRIEPLKIEMARSRFFDDAQRFAPGEVKADCALP